MVKPRKLLPPRLQKIKSPEQPSMAENPAFFQNPTTEAMSSSAPDFEESANVSFERESQDEFRYGIDPPRPKEGICIGNEPMLSDIGSSQHSFDEMPRLSVNNPSFVQNPTSLPVSLSASDFEESANVSFERESQDEFRYGIALPRPKEGIFTGNQPILSGMPINQYLLDKMHRLSVNNPSFEQNPTSLPLSSSAPDFEESAHVSSERESQDEFRFGIDPPRPKEGICTGIEPILSGMSINQYLLDEKHRLSVNNPSFEQNPTSLPVSSSAPDFEESAHVSFERESQDEFLYAIDSPRPREGVKARSSVYIPSPIGCPNLGYELSSSNTENVGMGLLKTGKYRDNSRNKVLHDGGYENLIGTEFPSIRQDRDLNLNDPLNKHVVDVPNQLLSTYNENIQQDENSDCTINDISVVYLKLYQETRPQDYDFAINLMAYIEFLNDNSWTATFSYLDENVKTIVTRIWNNLHITFNETMRLKGYTRNSVLKLMTDFNKWSINKKFEFEIFLNCCILLCHLGVFARKHIFQDASFYAIGLLRDRMQVLKFENLVQYMFDIVLKDYAKRQCEM